MNYFICGFTGAGKSSLLGELKAEQLLSSYRFIDLDEYILKKFSKYKSLGDLIRNNSFSFFRAQEKKALEELVKQARNSKTFLALGGGTLNAETTEILKEWKGLWLDTDFETCYERIKLDKNRPLTEQSKEELRKLYETRLKLYSQYEVFARGFSL